MKCGFAMAVLALSALDAMHPRAREWPLTIAGVVQEESTGNGTLATLLAGATADAALLVEPTGLELWTGAVGVIWCDVTTHGRAAHAMSAGEGRTRSRSLWPMIQACEDYGRALERAARHAERYTINVGMLSAGEWQSMVPSEARMTVRFGFPSTWDPTARETEIRDDDRRRGGARPVDGRTPARRGVSRNAGAGLCAPRGRRLRAGPGRDAHRARTVTNPRSSSHQGTTDARFYRNRARIPPCCYGPRVRNIHAANEAVELRSIVDGARTLTRFLPAWCGDRGAAAARRCGTDRGTARDARDRCPRACVRDRRSGRDAAAHSSRGSRRRAAADAGVRPRGRQREGRHHRSRQRGGRAFPHRWDLPRCWRRARFSRRPSSTPAR